MRLSSGSLTRMPVHSALILINKSTLLNFGILPRRPGPYCRSSRQLQKDPSPTYLEAQLLTSIGGDAALDGARAKLGVRVRDAREGTLGSGIGRIAEADVADDGVADHVAVGRVDCLGAAVLEDGGLDQELCVLAGVDAGADRGEVAAARGELCVVS